MTVLICLTRGKFAVVDNADAKAIAAYAWNASKRKSGYYAQSSMCHAGGGWKNVLMHRFIMSPPPDMVVDHINGDSLDNRRANLRVATRQQNSWNARPKGPTRFSGVMRRAGHWIARIEPNGHYVGLGSWPTNELAAAAYNRAAKAFYGEFARLNDVPDMPEHLWDEMIDAKRREADRLYSELQVLAAT